MTEGASGDPSDGFEDVSAAPAGEPLTTPVAGAPPSTEPRPATSDAIPRTKTGIAFGSLIAGAIVLILLLVFILENTQSIKISFFGASGHLPLGVALLLAAIGGGLLVGVVGTARIIQLRRHVRRRR